MWNKYRFQHQHDLIRAHLRVLCRFLCVLKSINKHVSEFKDVYDPQKYDDAILAIHKIAGFDASKNTFAAPSAAYNLGSLLKKVGNIYT